MNDLKVINDNGKLLVDSREVASMIDKEHKHLLRDIRGYLEVLGKSNFGLADFFIESYYSDSQGKPRPHFFLTKRGCDMVANKLTGKKGVLFTATYVSKFEEMKAEIESKPQSQAEMLLMYAQQFVKQEQEIKQIKSDNETIKHRLDNIDSLDTIGDLQQRLNGMVRRYAQQEGLAFGVAWRDFRQAFNTAYRTNLKNRMNHYKEKHGLKSLTMPQYLSLTDNLEDAIRVADKMLNTEAV